MVQLDVKKIKQSISLFCFNNRYKIGHVLTACLILVAIFYAFLIIRMTGLFTSKISDDVSPFLQYLNYYGLIGTFIVFVVVFSLSRAVGWNFWFSAMLFLMLLTLVTGIIFISSELGKEKLSLQLRSENNSIFGNITCQDNSGNLIVGNTAICEYNPRLLDDGHSITFSYQNGWQNSSLFEKLEFEIQPNVKRIDFNLWGRDTTNKFVKLSAGYNIHFLTKEEELSRHEKVVQYSMALIGIILLTIPIVVYNIKRLYIGKD